MLQLTDDMKTNVPKIDNQHQELIDLINELVTVNTHLTKTLEVEKTLKFLTNYVVKHFTDEEVLQRQTYYPKYDWHRSQHQEYIKAVNELKEDFKRSGSTPQFSLQIQQTIINWIVKHIKHADVEFGRFLNEKK
ncbi:MAG: bacteriohemerythrin [Turicibacter sp.]|nr:bacteriohemerythrin [Turicibacter sp.]